MNKRRLGRGLEALLGPRGRRASSPARSNRPSSSISPSIRLTRIPSSRAGISAQVRSPAWPTRCASTACFSRSWFEQAGTRYQLIAGERRLRASIEAQLHEVPARSCSHSMINVSSSWRWSRTSSAKT